MTCHIRTAKVGESVLSFQLNTTNHPLFIGQKGEKVAKMPISALFSLTDGFLMILVTVMMTAGSGVSEAGPGFSETGPGPSEAGPGLSEAGSSFPEGWLRLLKG